MLEQVMWLLHENICEVTGSTEGISHQDGEYVRTPVRSELSGQESTP